MEVIMNFNELEGKVLFNIIGKIGDDEMVFITNDNEKYRLFHSQDCCENVQIEDIIGDLNDLIGRRIIMADMAVSTEKNPIGVKIPEYQESFTWTFYKLATVWGYVTIRWYGESNGYYSEKVDFEKC